MTSQVPELPRQLLRDTNDLMTTLDRTVANLREFTERLRAATEAQRLEES
jgi:hypothetical protein